MRKKQRIKNIKRGIAESLEFENQYEQALIDLEIDYIRSKSESWDFIIITPLDYVFIELKYKYHNPNKTQMGFIKKNWDRYLVINLLIHKESPEYTIKYYYEPFEKLVKEHTLQTIHQVAFYPVFRLFGVYNLFIEEYLKKVGNDNILVNYRWKTFTNALKYMPDFDALSPEEIRPTQNVNRHLFSKGAEPIILTKTI